MKSVQYISIVFLAFPADVGSSRIFRGAIAHARTLLVPNWHNLLHILTIGSTLEQEHREKRGSYLTIINKILWGGGHFNFHFRKLCLCRPHLATVIAFNALYDPTLSNILLRWNYNVIQALKPYGLPQSASSGHTSVFSRGQLSLNLTKIILQYFIDNHL